MAERSVEGRHSRIHRVLKRAPNASVPYLSLEMRFPLLQELLATKPECMRSLLTSWTKLETTAGMQKAVMPLTHDSIFSRCLCLFVCFFLSLFVRSFVGLVFVCLVGWLVVVVARVVAACPITSNYLLLLTNH